MHWQRWHRCGLFPYGRESRLRSVLPSINRFFCCRLSILENTLTFILHIFCNWMICIMQLRNCMFKYIAEEGKEKRVAYVRFFTSDTPETMLGDAIVKQTQTIHMTDSVVDKVDYSTHTWPPSRGGRQGLQKWWLPGEAQRDPGAPGFPVFSKVGLLNCITSSDLMSQRHFQIYSLIWGSSSWDAFFTIYPIFSFPLIVWLKPSVLVTFPIAGTKYVAITNLKEERSIPTYSLYSNLQFIVGLFQSRTAKRDIMEEKQFMMWQVEGFLLSVPYYSSQDTVWLINTIHTREEFLLLTPLVPVRHHICIYTLGPGIQIQTLGSGLLYKFHCFAYFFINIFFLSYPNHRSCFLFCFQPYILDLSFQYSLVFTWLFWSWLPELLS